MYICVYICIYVHDCLDPSQTEYDRFRPPCDLATIVDVVGDRVLSLVCLRPMYNHHMVVAADRQWSQMLFGAQDRALVTY